MGNSETRALARRLAALEKWRLQSKQPNLGFSTVEGGALQVTDDDDSIKLIIGQQFDETRTVAIFNGPIPPMPSTPVCDSVPGGFRVRWDGYFVDNALCPMDFQRVEVHSSDDPEFSALTADTLKNTFETPRGSEVFVATTSSGNTQYVRLVTRSQSGVVSVPSPPVEVIPSPAVSAEDFLTVQTTAIDASNTAYAADGRVSISDYEPGPADVPGKQDGSLWITRTRDRQNLSTNPSFEASLADWADTAASSARTASTPAGDGAYVMRITNDASVGDHTAVWDVGALVSPAQEVTVSGYVKLVSGSGVGVHARIEWFDASDVSLGVSDGVADTAVVDDPDDDDSDYVRVWATATAPASAHHFAAIFNNPNASDVWDLDATLFEFGRLGRYFDGESEGGAWLGTADLSMAELDGGAIIRLFTLEDGSWNEKFWTADTIASVSASVIDRGEMNGAFLEDHTVTAEKRESPLMLTSEAVTAGNIVNVYTLGGESRVRLADANVTGREATGFVLESAGSGDPVRVYTTGMNPYVSGLIPGPQFLSETAGEVSSTRPVAAGSFVQRVGFASNSTTLNFVTANAVALI
jgi:hypothetical protein